MVAPAPDDRRDLRAQSWIVGSSSGRRRRRYGREVRDGTVTWRLELPLSWGGRWEPSWLPSGDAEAWRRVYVTEDRAGGVFAAGGAGLTWRQLARAVAQLSFVLEQYRTQLRAADEVAAACPVAAERHLAALVVPAGLEPPRYSGPAGPWRVCVLDGERPAVVETVDAVDVAEGAVAAERVLAPARPCWAEPVGARPVGSPVATGAGWRPRVDVALRLRAFAAEEVVAALSRAAATGHTGPDVVGTALLCTLGVAVHRMILEYRTLFRDVWTDLDACARTARHDTDATALLGDPCGDPGPEPDGGPGHDGRRWRHAVLDGASVRTVSEHADRGTAAASVAAYRAVDDRAARWAEPVALAR